METQGPGEPSLKSTVPGTTGSSLNCDPQPQQETGLKDPIELGEVSAWPLGILGRDTARGQRDGKYIPGDFKMVLGSVKSSRQKWISLKFTLQTGESHLAQAAPA